MELFNHIFITQLKGPVSLFEKQAHSIESAMDNSLDRISIQSSTCVVLMFLLIFVFRFLPYIVVAGFDLMVAKRPSEMGFTSSTSTDAPEILGKESIFDRATRQSIVNFYLRLRDGQDVKFSPPRIPISMQSHVWFFFFRSHG